MQQIMLYFVSDVSEEFLNRSVQFLKVVFEMVYYQDSVIPDLL